MYDLDPDWYWLNGYWYYKGVRQRRTDSGKGPTDGQKHFLRRRT